MTQKTIRQFQKAFPEIKASDIEAMAYLKHGKPQKEKKTFKKGLK